MHGLMWQFIANILINAYLIYSVQEIKNDDAAAVA